jgi:hypothetical protein
MNTEKKHRAHGRRMKRNYNPLARARGWPAASRLDEILPSQNFCSPMHPGLQRKYSPSGFVPIGIGLYGA